MTASTVGHEPFEHLLYRVESPIATIQFNRPEVMNAFSYQLYGEIKRAVRTAQHDPAVEIIVIKGSKGVFNTGGDVKQALEVYEREGWVGLYRFRDGAPWDAVRDCPKITIAVVEGTCLAGGLVLTTACDITIATESSTFGFNEVLVGVADRIAPSFLFGRVGTAKAKYLLLTGKRIDAAEAERIGLITESVPEPDIDARLAEIVEELRQSPVDARALYKEFWNDMLHRPINDGEERVAAAMKEGLEAHRARQQSRPR